MLKRWTLIVGLGLLVSMFWSGAVLAEFVPTSDCLECHLEADEDCVAVDMDAYAISVHGDLDCVDCHGDIEELPHEDILAKANCGNCHEDIAEIYTRHGLGLVADNGSIPGCADCHGSHDIREVEDRESRVNTLNLPTTCGRCHEDEGFTSEQHIRFKHPVRVYSNSVHGRAALGGIHSAASCNDCHSVEGDAHRILPPGDVDSPINHFNISKTCGNCHRYIEQDYMEGIHGELTQRGQVDSPICTTCHGEHNILPTLDPRSPVSSRRLAEATCSPCHESASLNEKYELPTGRLHSFQDSYHGLKSKAGDVTVANCASCHGAHRILASADSSSTVHPSNLQTTCGGCHPEISAEIAQMPIHAESEGLHTGIAGIVKKIYILLIILVIGSMVLHWLIDLRKQISELMKKPSVRRMEGDEVVQHFILALSFTVLVITGFSLRYYDAWWSEMLFGWEGGYTFRGDLHRIAGVVLLMGSVWHAIFLLTPRGRTFIKDMALKKEDLFQFLQMVGFNLGMRKDHPQFGRFSYVEKTEYWALVWGTAVMGITGLMLWFDNIFVNWVFKGILDVMLVIHYYEAWLAFLAILIWHLYSTVFSPKVYPMNPAWLNGKMPLEQFKAEHPLAPIPTRNGEPAKSVETKEGDE